MRQINYCQKTNGELAVRFYPIKEDEKKDYKIMKPREVTNEEWEKLAEGSIEEVKDRVAEVLGLVSNLGCA